MLRKERKRYKLNPYLVDVAYDLIEDKKLIRTVGNRKSVIDGKNTIVTTQDYAKGYKDVGLFTKLYSRSNALHELIELTASAQRMLVYIIENKLESDKSYVWLTVGLIGKELEMSDSTTNASFNELLDREWLCRSDEQHKYWINIARICVGARDTIYFKEYGANLVKLKSDELNGNKSE